MVPYSRLGHFMSLANSPWLICFPQLRLHEALAEYGRETDRQISQEARRLTPPVSHALVRAHPETGDRSLYLDATTTVGIDDMDTAAGLALLDEIYESATREEFVYAHQWYQTLIDRIDH